VTSWRVDSKRPCERKYESLRYSNPPCSQKGWLMAYVYWR